MSSRADLEREITAVLFEKYQKRAPEDAWWLARDDATVIVRNLDLLLPILKGYSDES